MGTSPTRAFGYCVVCDVTDLICCRRRMYAYVGVAEQGCIE
jgi:hypothetical protein